MSTNDSSTPASEIKPDGWMSRSEVVHAMGATNMPIEQIAAIADAMSLWHERSQKRADEVAALRAEVKNLRERKEGLFIRCEREAAASAALRAALSVATERERAGIEQDREVAALREELRSTRAELRVAREAGDNALADITSLRAALRESQLANTEWSREVERMRRAIEPILPVVHEHCSIELWKPLTDAYRATSEQEYPNNNQKDTTP